MIGNSLSQEKNVEQFKIKVEKSMWFEQRFLKYN